MKKNLIFLTISLLPLLSIAQTRVAEVTQLSVNYGAAPTVTFEVWWATPPTPPRHRDTVWVFVDYQTIAADGTLGVWSPHH
jgi:hypothetical protein